MPRFKRGTKLLELPKRFQRDAKAIRQSALAQEQASERTRERPSSFHSRFKGGKNKKHKKK